MCGITGGEGAWCSTTFPCMLVGEQKYYSHVRCTMQLPDIHSDWMSMASLNVRVIYVGPLSHLEV